MPHSARLEARLTPEIHALLKRAAEIEGRSLTDFVVAAASAAAHRTLEQTEVLRLSAPDQARFVEALLTETEPAPAMLRAFDHHRRLIG